MQPEKEFSDYFSKFIKIQNENNLANIQVDGIYLWRLIRGPLFVSILEETQVIYKSEAKNKSATVRLLLVLQNLFSYLYKIEKWKQLPSKLAKTKTLFIDIINIVPSMITTGMLMLWGTEKDVFISAFIRKIGADYRLTSPAEEKHKNNYILLDKPNAGLFLSSRLDTRAFSLIARKFFDKEISEDINPAISKIAKAYGIEVGVIKKLAKKQLKTFKAHEAAFMHFFNKSKFTKAYLCWNRFYMPLLSAAKKSGISTSEFQHGTITPFHIMYAWQSADFVPYTPDNLLCFGPVWAEETGLPKSINPVIIGAPHLEACIDKSKPKAPDTNQVIVFSQNVIGQKLLNFSLEVARLRPDLNFIFKPHPAENYADITHYAEGDIPENFKFANVHDDSYKLMAEASYQIGVSSTTLNEGMALGNRVIIVPFASWEYLEPAINRGDAHLAKTPQKAAELLTTNTPVCIDSNTYYAPMDLSKL